MVQHSKFDVFLSHSSKDKPQVREIASELKRRGLSVWIDEEQIRPGQSIQDVIQQAISTVKSVAVFIGAEDPGRLQVRELKALINQSVTVGVPIIPVLLPGVSRIPDDIPFLNNFVSVSFTHGIGDTQALDRLEWSITRQRPEQKAEPIQGISSELSEHFDIFLCFQSKDQLEVKRISEELREYKINSWPDRWELNAEISWQKLLTSQVGEINSLAVFVGNDEVPWADEDVEIFIWECIEGGSLVVPVILASALQAPKLPVYLKRRKIIDFRDKDSNPMMELVSLIHEKLAEEGSSHG